MTKTRKIRATNFVRCIALRHLGAEKEILVLKVDKQDILARESGIQSSPAFPGSVGTAAASAFASSVFGIREPSEKHMVATRRQSYIDGCVSRSNHESNESGETFSLLLVPSSVVVRSVFSALPQSLLATVQNNY